MKSAKPVRLRTVSVLGFGGRGRIYTQNFDYLGVKVTAVCDPNPARRELASTYTDKLYETEEEFFAQGKLSDLLIIATMDKQHRAQAIKAMELGYDLLLEKPVATSAEDCVAIEQAAKKYGRKVTVCHVLRYAPLYVETKKLLDSGKLGKVINLAQIERVGYYHFAHSFVRGNWRNVATSAPSILAKSCHDMDMITWLVNSKCESVSSFGSTEVFKEENAPEGSAVRCQDCKYKDSCKYSCFKIYLNEYYEQQAALSRHGQLGETHEERIANLSDGKNLLGRCVYRCDNDVCDNQVVNMHFENGANAQFILSAFTEGMNREVNIMCENGEIHAQEKELVYYVFGDPTPHKIEITYQNEQYASHGGGDMGIVKAVYDGYVEEKEQNVSDIEYSIISHLMCFAAEESRKQEGKVILIDALKQ